MALDAAEEEEDLGADVAGGYFCLGSCCGQWYSRTTATKVRNDFAS